MREGCLNFLRNHVPYILIYVLTLVAANLVVAWVGPVATPIVAFLLIGFDLTLRDYMHDRWQGRSLWPRMLALITSAGLVSYVVDPATGSIAVASVVAFGLSSLVAAGVYQLLVRRSWSVRANGSNIVGAAVDSLIFPLLAFGAVLPSIILAQWVAKVVGGMLWAMIIGRVGRPANARVV
jgi:uncharacterized PurR-regulated membrane protein YhhQ (DUF165 family)